MSLPVLALALGASFASGLNLYATVAALGLFHHFGVIHLPPSLEVLAHPLVLGVALTLYVVEFVADKIPLVDSAWDVVHTFIRPPAAAVLAYSAVGDVPEPWRIAAALLAGGVALIAHGAKASTRAAANASPEPFSNWILSLGEDVLAVVVAWVAAEHPLIALAVVGMLIAGAVFVVVKLFGFLRGLFGRLLRRSGGTAAPPAAALAAGLLLTLAGASGLQAAPLDSVAPVARRDTAAAHPRSLARSLTEGAKAFGSDAWHVASSPARINRGTAIWVGGVALAAGVLYNNDQEVLDALHRNHDDGNLRAALDVGEAVEPVGFMGNTNPIYFGALAAGYFLEVEPLSTISAQILESHFLAGGIRNVGKLLVGRSRPADGLGARHFEFNEGVSFPSGHTSVVFELATILSHHVDHPAFTVVAYGLATTVALQRIDSGSHWASDVFVAAAYGTAVARTVVRRHEERKLRLEPALVPGSGTVGLKVEARY